MKEKTQFYDLGMIDICFDLSVGQLRESLILLEHLESCKDKPYVLDEDIVNSIIKQQPEHKKMFPITLKQCALWRTQNPTPEQLCNIEKIEGYTKRLQRSTEKILFIADHYKDHTIDRILEKMKLSWHLIFYLEKCTAP